MEPGTRRRTGGEGIREVVDKLIDYLGCSLLIELAVGYLRWEGLDFIGIYILRSDQTC